MIDFTSHLRFMGKGSPESLVDPRNVEILLIGGQEEQDAQTAD